MSEKLNKAGDTRGMHVRTPETRTKQAVRTLKRQIAQYLRSCDSKVGKYLRKNELDKYNETLEKVDNATSKCQK